MKKSMFDMNTKIHPILTKLKEEEFYLVSPNEEGYRKFKLVGSTLTYNSNTSTQILDVENLRIQLVSNQSYGQGIVLYQSQQTFELYGEVDDWFNTLCRYCIQMDFTNKYLVQKLIGEGTFAKVYKARHKIEQVDYAVKAFDKQKMQQEIDRQALFKELSILRHINHFNILKLKEVFECRQFIFVVLEYLPGQDLYRFIANNHCDENRASKIIQKILDAVQYMHKSGIIHRDIKPQNILFRNSFDDIVLADFGLADFYRKDGQYLFKRCGTPGFVAPEVLHDKLYDYKVDVFSVGVIMYLLLTGKQPFRSNNLDEIVQLNYDCAVDYGCLEISKDALNLLQGLLNPNPQLRFSVYQARVHPWVMRNVCKLKSDQLSSFRIHSHNNVHKSEINQFHLPSIEKKTLYQVKKICKTEQSDTLDTPRTRKIIYSQLG